ncbi:MAG: ATP-binding protein [Chloroflexota bacterium]
MRQHKLSLCKEHYLEWLPEQTERFIQKYNMFTHKDKVLVAVSGGKDSLTLWEILWKSGYVADGLYINLGIDGQTKYSEMSRQIVLDFARERALRFTVVDVEEEFRETVPQIAARTLRGKAKPCSVCGLVKRHIMNRVARDAGYNILATGHNLDDEAAALFGNTLSWAKGYLIRQNPVLESIHPGVIKKVKPFFRFYERETAAYAVLSRITYVYDECPYSIGSKTIYYKGLLNQLEADRPGAKLHFFLAFLKAKKEGLFAQPPEKCGLELKTCPVCGQPTTVPDTCAFCRMMDKVKSPTVKG